MPKYLVQILLWLTLLTASAVHGSSHKNARLLFEQQKFQEAAEMFTDPFWQGIAYYRAGLWLNAAESFARSDNPLSSYNLANSYAQLGHYTLALETYNQVLQHLPDFSEAEENADLMRRLLTASSDDQRSQPPQNSPQSPSDTEGKKQPSDKNSSANKPQSQNKQNSQSESSNNGRHQNSNKSSPPQTGGAEQSGPASALQEQAKERNTGKNKPGPPEKKQSEEDSKADDAKGEQTGQQNLESAAAREGEKSLDHKAQKKQSMEQWMVTIDDRPARFLRARIAQSIRQRKAAGTLAEPEGPGW